MGIAVALVVVMTGQMATAASAAAASLVASNPAPREEVSQPPGWVTLAFARTVSKNAVKVLVVNSEGRNVVTGDLIYMGSSVMVQLEDGVAKDTYTVKYRLDRADGQPEGGAFQFAYGKGRWTAVDASWSGAAEQPPEMANPDPYATGSAQTPTAPATEVQVEESTPPPTVTPSQTAAAPTAPATPGPVASPGNGPLWIGLSAGVVVLLAAVGGWFVVRRRRKG